MTNLYIIQLVTNCRHDALPLYAVVNHFRTPQATDLAPQPRLEFCSRSKLQRKFLGFYYPINYCRVVYLA